MKKPTVKSTWQQLVACQATCSHCLKNADFPLVHPQAKPLFGRFTPWLGGVLFVFEAPNRDDTLNPDKGYLTYDLNDDSTARFTTELIESELGLPLPFFQVTNAVLCLPREHGGKFPVTGVQAKACSEHIKNQILTLQPVIVATVGGVALRALSYIERHSLTRLSECVAKPKPWFGRLLYPLYHTSQLGRIGRPADKQRQDWRKLRRVMAKYRVAMPSDH